jgi:hypothetical protein
VKKLQDLLDIYGRAYKDFGAMPNCIEVVKSVADYSTWLVEEQGDVFKGFARRVPDHCRPHQFIFRRDHTEAGVAMDYKNLSIDATKWNLGQKPAVLLKGMPDASGPRYCLMEYRINACLTHCAVQAASAFAAASSRALGQIS